MLNNQTFFRLSLAALAMCVGTCANANEKLTDVTHSLSNGVKWQTQSKEYRYITSVTYQKAAQVLKSKPLPNNPWVVVMDVDETILDNSPYQLFIEQKGIPYTPKTWDEWVESENATLVPGVKDFINTVFELGGTLGLVTNRNREQDQYTWNNIQALAIPISIENTCLMGRIKEDKTSVNNINLINDKDLRRQQLETSTANCYSPNSKRSSLLPPLEIIMQVGDNIEDFSGITQENANVEKLLSHTKNELVLLPNPVYGSW